MKIVSVKSSFLNKVGFIVIAAYEKLQRQLQYNIENRLKSQGTNPDEALKQANEFVNSTLNQINQITARLSNSEEAGIWLFKNVINGSIIFPEDSEKSAELLKQFFITRKSGNWKSPKQLNDYKRFSDLFNAVRSFLSTKEVSKGLETNVKGAEEILQKGPYKVIRIDEYKAAKQLCEKSGWCVRYEDHFKHYGPPFYLVVKNGEQFALIHFPSKQLKDIANEVFSPDKIDKDLYDIVVQLNGGKPYFKNDFSVLFKFATTKEDRFVAVQQNGDLIQYLDNPSEDEQLAAVKETVSAIRHIMRKGITPSEEVQMAAIQHKDNEDIIEDIIREGIIPSEAVQLAAVKKDGYVLTYIVQILVPSPEVQLAAVQNKGAVIKYIKNPSPEVQLAAVQNNGNAIEFIMQKGITPSETVQLAAVQNNGHAISFIKNPSEAVQIAAMGNRSDIAIHHIHEPTERVQELIDLYETDLIKRVVVNYKGDIAQLYMAICNLPRKVSEKVQLTIIDSTPSMRELTRYITAGRELNRESIKISEFFSSPEAREKIREKINKEGFDGDKLCDSYFNKKAYGWVNKNCKFARKGKR